MTGVKKPVKGRINLDEVGQEDEQEKSGDERHSEAGSEEPPSDYDVEEEYDNDYAENYFDNGEGDDLDNLGDGGMGDDGGGAGMFSIFSATHRRTFCPYRLRLGMNSSELFLVSLLCITISDGIALE